MNAAASTRRDGHATGMAGEFFVMEKLFRLGHEPALTLGNAKSIDVLVRRSDGTLREVSVKAIRGGGKWGVASEDESAAKTRVYVLLLYRDFDNPKADVDVFVIPARDVQRLKEPWFKGHAIYCSNAVSRDAIEKYRDAWHHI
jgi:hypothetical protein